MPRYYTRACNFYYGINAKLLIKKRLALPLCGNKNIAFDKVEIITRKKLSFKNISFDGQVSVSSSKLNIC